MTSASNNDEGYTEADATFVEWMELYDQILAQQDVAVFERPLRAAVLFARHTVAQVTDKGSVEAVRDDVDLGDLIGKPWFGNLVRIIEGWYTKMFGPEALRPPERTLFGAVMHRGAIQLLQIPLIVTQQAEAQHQRWIAFPDHVGDCEDVLSWVRPKPHRSEMHPGVVSELGTEVRRIASAIRFIASRARDASKGSAELSGLLASGVRSLESFAHLAAEEGRPERQKAWWELQMANEAFLKAFCLQKGRTGGYRRIHTLPTLVRDAQECGLHCKPEQFADWPSDRKMSDYRYATGRSVSSGELFCGYELTLRLCGAVASSLSIGIDTGKARFLIQPLPWRLRELGVDKG
jgi:hypothetical protein